MTQPTRPPLDAAAQWPAINSLRVLAMDAVEAANSGHPGTPMALAPAAWVLWTRHLKHAPQAPTWADRDRFVLSCGHASMLLYGLLHLTGYDLPLDEIRQFRQWGSKTPGHPERGHTVGVETTTGPLGQGIGNAVGMAIAERMLRETYGPEVCDHRTWVIASDGDVMEGVASEAASLAGHLKLDRLCVVWDDNKITIDGRTDLAFTEDVGARFRAYGWHVLHVRDGNDLADIDAALTSAAAHHDAPTLIVLNTIIADPAPTKRDTSGAHGAPLGAAEIAATKAILGWPSEPFHVAEGAYDTSTTLITEGNALVAAWESRVAAHPRGVEFRAQLAGTLPSGWDASLPNLEGQSLATRQASQQALAALAPIIPGLAGGSADLGGSNGTNIKHGDVFGPTTTGPRFNWGVREHGMAAALNGMAAHGGVRPYGATFLVFADYCKPSIRLAALMGLPVIYVFSHDSIGVGEDGPTHQPIEHLAMLRGIPNLVTLRPADAAETVEAWKVAITRTAGPTALILTRQKLPALTRATDAVTETARGGYIVHEPATAARAVILATGSEVSVAVAAAATLDGEGIPTRVVSMPSWELFTAQDAAWRERVLPASLSARVSIEA
ncbi:MAG TPA: transketolase, partial [Gemmatimonadales bacterium]|nr:transketolase [Gemmatimonadales bacterium]